MKARWGVAVVLAAALGIGLGACAKRVPSGERVLEEVTGKASWYGKKFHGRKTASGETYDMHAFTAAHRTFPFGARVRVINLENGRATTVRINDRGPWKGGRVIDLSYAAAKALEMIGPGVVRVKIQVLEWGRK